MQLLNMDCSEDILVCVTKCTELLCKQISCDQGTEDDTQPYNAAIGVVFTFKYMLHNNLKPRCMA
jgi:hypothetical protein